MNELTAIGKDLLKYAELEAEFSAQRGLLDELFPFIYMASKRMSLRAITRWLEDTHRIQISVNAVAKAMRNQEEYWARLVEDVEPSARIMAEAYTVAPSEILDSFDLFKHLEMTPQAGVVVADNYSDIEKGLRELARAVGVIRNRWFSLPEDVRNQCRRHFVGVFFEPEEPPKEEKENERKKTTK